MKRIIVLLIVTVVICSCNRAPETPFIVDKRLYSSKDSITINQLGDEFIYTRAFSMPESYDVDIRISTSFPEIQVTSFIASPKKYDDDRIIYACMGVCRSDTNYRVTVEGFQSARVYSYAGKTIAINNDDSFITFFTEDEINYPSDSILSEEIAVQKAIVFLEQCDLINNIDLKPVKIINNVNSFEITFAKKYYGLFTYYKSYPNFASTQGFPVDGEFITIDISQSGIESFYALLKEPSYNDQSIEIISPSAILNHLEKYLEQKPFSSGDHLTIYDLELVYLATPLKDSLWSSQYVLSWIISGTTNTGSIYSIYINAVNGMVVL